MPRQYDLSLKGLQPLQPQELTEAEEVSDRSQIEQGLSGSHQVPDGARPKRESPGKGCSECKLFPTFYRPKSAETLPACTQARGSIFHLNSEIFLYRRPVQPEENSSLQSPQSKMRLTIRLWENHSCTFWCNYLGLQQH